MKPRRTPSDHDDLFRARLGQGELDALHLAVKKSRPYGGDRWSARIIAEHDLISTTRGRGRPVITD